MLFAMCDRAIDIADCLKLKPTAKELKNALPWLVEKDGNPDWPEHVNNTLNHLAKELGYEL